MATPPTEKSNTELCTITVMFPVTSAEQAIDYKKKISALLSEIPNARIQFGLMSTTNNKVNAS